MFQDGPGSGGTEDNGLHAARAAAARAGEDVGVKRALEGLGPGDGAAERGQTGSGATGQEAALSTVGAAGAGTTRSRTRALGGEDAEVTHQVGPRRRNELSGLLPALTSVHDWLLTSVLQVAAFEMSKLVPLRHP